MDTKQQALEAAMLARLVGSHLHSVDSMMTERSNNPANKIDMHKFVAPITGQTVNSNELVSGVTPAMLKAVQDAERLAMQSVPDTSIGSSLAPIDPTPVHAPIPQQIPVQAPVPQQTKQISVDEGVLTKEDVLAIRSQLERVNATLTKMSGMLGKVFANFTEKNKTLND
jgi:hypothetical protein